MTPALAPRHRLWTNAPLFTALTILIALAALPLASAALIDPRTFQGDGIWIKPLKFHAALSIYLATLAVFARYLPTRLQRSRPWRIYLAVAAVTIIAELVWVGGAAALGTASHFNVTSPLWASLYAIMGLAAVTLTSLSLAIGIAIWRNPATGLPPAMHLAISLGLILTFILTLVTAGTMSSGTAHLIGSPVTGLRLPVMGWSREVGDLRAPHFFATHALHAIPLAGFTNSRAIVLLATIAYTAFVLTIFAQALMGHPLI